MRIDPQAPDAPLLQLVRRLHANTDLASRVRKARYRRVRVKEADVDVEGLDEALQAMQSNTTNETQETQD